MTPTRPHRSDAAGDPAPPPPPPLVYWSRRLADDIDPLAVYAVSDEPHRNFLRVRDEGEAFAAIGVAAAIEIDSTTRGSRFQAVARARFRLGRTVTPADSLDSGPSPVLIGGFAFDPQHQPGPESDWVGFPAAQLTLARVLVRRTASGAVWVTAATPTAQGAAESRRRIDNEIDALVEASRSWRAPADSPGDRAPAKQGSTKQGSNEQGSTEHGLAAADQTQEADPTYGFLSETELHDATYPELVRRILAEVGAGRLDKVVAARALDLPRTPEPGDHSIAADLDSASLAQALADRFSNATVFAFSRGDRTFLGASPELLVRIDGRGVHTEAIAGSRPRGADAVDDAAIADAMATDPKEQAEHRFVIENLRRNLTSGGVQVEDPKGTRVRKLPGIQHLFTPLRGLTSATSTTAIAMVGALHPSAAVCGTPSADALRFLRAHEDLERGWYAGPVGWTDLDGRGEFFVALRSGVLGPTHLRLFAGAGIVEGSDPDRELAETSMKFHAVLDPARRASRATEEWSASTSAPAATAAGVRP